MDDEKTTGGQEEAQAPSLLDSLEAEWDKMEADTEEAPPVEEPEQSPEPEEPQDQEAGGEVEASEKVPEETEEVGPEAEESAEEVEIPAAPEHWAQSDRETFNNLPDEAKQPYLAARKSLEAGYDAKFKDIAESRRQAEAIDEAFKPVDGQLALEGVDRATAIKRLVSAQQYLEQSPAEAIQWLAKQYNVDLAAFGHLMPEDANLDPVAQENAQRIARLESTIVSREQAAQAASQQQLQEQIDAFKGAKDDNGNLRHPHFEEVRETMALFVNQGADMEKAYEQAVWARPEIRENLLKAQTQKVEVSRKKAVEKAKKASRNPKSRSVASAPTDQPAGSYSDELNRLWDQQIEATQ